MITEVRNAQALLEALERKDDEILVCGDYCAEINPNLLTPWQGLIRPLGMPVFANLIESIINIKNGVPKDQAKIEQKLRLYYAKYKSKDEIMLRLNQLDY